MVIVLSPLPAYFLTILGFIFFTSPALLVCKDLLGILLFDCGGGRGGGGGGGGRRKEWLLYCK